LAEAEAAYDGRSLPARSTAMYFAYKSSEAASRWPTCLSWSPYNY
jgi:hypothetical protein